MPTTDNSRNFVGDADWSALEPLLDRLLDATPEDRAAILDAARIDDPASALQAERLLQKVLEDNVLPESLNALAPELFTELAEKDVRDLIGERVGPYRIVELIRRGGMGIVYRADRADGTFEQSVAIKVIPASIASETARVLFDRERQNLARLEHPNIARIIDAGVTENATPYFVMEFIDGERIDSALQSQSAGRRQVLDCFMQLCDAVAYCHRSMIVHGDIKPENVMIADGRVRLLDFGIGRLLDEVDKRADVSTPHAYSPGFSAPEQEDGATPTIQSDIYSLGAVLKLLLSRFSASADTQAIVASCLATDPADRYDSVVSLRADLRNHIAHHPVSVRKPTPAYRAGRFVRRNKLLVGATLAVLAALGAGLTIAIWQHDAARQQALRAEEISAFLTSLFEQADPVVAGEQETTLREIVDVAASRLETELHATPDVRTELTQLLGNAYFGIGDFDRSLELHQEALLRWQSAETGPSLNIVRALNAVGADWSRRGDYLTAEAFHRQSLDQLRALQLEESIHAADTWTQLGTSFMQTDPSAAREAMLTAHEINLRVRPQDKGAIARSIAGVASGYRAERNIEESLRYHQQALALALDNDELLAPEVLTIRCNLALDLGTLGRHVDALAAQSECIDLTEKRFGPEHPGNVANLNNLGSLQLRVGDLAAAERTYVRALAIAESQLPPKSLDRLAAEINYSVVLWHSGQTTAAESRLDGLLPRMEMSVGSTHAASGRVRTLLGRLVLARGDADSAIELIESSLPGLIPSWRADALLWLAESWIVAGDPAAAAQLAEESIKLRESIPHFTDWQIAESRWVLGVASGDEQLSAAALQLFEDKLPPKHFRRNTSLTTGKVDPQHPR